MPRRIWDIIKMKVTQHRIIGKAILLGIHKAYTTTHTSFHLIEWNRYHKAQARLPRLHTTVDMLSDISYMDRTETSLRADVWPPWEDLPQSALGCVRSQTPFKMWHTKGVHYEQYPLEALVLIHEDTYMTYCHQRTPEAMEMILVWVMWHRRPKYWLCNKALMQWRDLKKPISQHKIQSHNIAYQIFEDSCLGAWISSSKYLVF